MESVLELRLTLLYRWRAKKLARMTPTTAPNTTPPILDPTTTEVETPESLDETSGGESTGPDRQEAYRGAEERQKSSPLPLCRGPQDHALLSASVRLIKKGDAQERETVQFKGPMGFASSDMILNGGWRAGATIMVYGGVPFLGTREMSVH